MISLHHNTFIDRFNNAGFLRLLVLLLCLLGGCAQVMAQTSGLVAEVDRQTVIDGESVVLYIKGTDLSTLPDLASLSTNFRIIDTGQSSSQTVVNGKSSHTYTLRLELQPKSLGSTVIPALTVGNVSTDPITVEVVARGTPGVEPRDKVFAELSVDKENPYVQEQVILSLEVFDDGNLVRPEPLVEGNSDYQIEKLPLGRERIVERNNVKYRVRTFRYALFPQQSGEMTIDEISIPGGIRENSYGGSLMLFNTPTRRIEFSSNSISFTVKPRAAGSTANWWLPVASHEVKHEWSGDISNAMVGEPLTLTLLTEAMGATPSQLPEITVPEVPGIKIYVDNPEFGSRPDANGIYSARRDKWSVIPNQGGQLTLPEVIIKWWDTEADVERSSVIPAQQLEVEGGSVAAPGSASADSSGDSSPVTASSSQGGESSAPAVNAMSDNQDADSSVGAIDSAQSSDVLSARGDAHEFVPRHWLWLAVAAVTAWLATLAGWWWSVKKSTGKQQASRKPPDNASERKAFRSMKSLAAGADTTAYSAAVLEWAGRRWPRSPVRNLPEVGLRLDDAELTDWMRRLDQQRFSPVHSTSQAVSINEIQKAIEEALQRQAKDTPEHDSHALPQL